MIFTKKIKEGDSMRLAALSTLEPGTVLARPVLDEKGKILLGRGVTLTESFIKRLYYLGITAVYIEDPMTDDILVEDLISEQTRQEAIGLVHSILSQMTASEQFPRLFQARNMGVRMQTLFKDILREMRSHKNLTVNLANIYAADTHLYHHSVNVSLIALAIALKMGFEDQQLIHLGIGTLLHDIGKLKIPEAIVNKPGKLTPEEFEIMKSHTIYGYQILRKQEDISFLSAHVALQHHERVDGSGYPRGLTGKEMHLFGKISAVADVYDALIANRIYRKGHLPHEGYEFVLGGVGTYFDAEVVRSFVSAVAIYPLGMTLKLSTGEEAVVCEIPPLHPQRPKVRVIRDSKGRRIDQPYEISLMDQLTTTIVGCKM
jgi:putative nucleotidyltransferase with HDIG domain